MKKFNEELDGIMEGYGMVRTVTRERFPSKLKLSEEFVSAFKKEFESQTSPIYTEDEDGSQILSRDSRDPKTVLKEFQKALKFLT
jgi:hypothetical protein